MKKLFLPLSIFSLIGSVLIFSSVQAGGNPKIGSLNTTVITPTPDSVTESKASAEAFTDALFNKLNLSGLGLKKQALQFAYRGHQKLVEEGAVSNPDILTIVDFSQSSSNKRMYIIDLKNEMLLLNTYVAHGKNSGLKYAERFSNKPESLQSSLGFYVTKNTYFGKHGLSLRLDGKDKGFNENAMARAIVVHGAAYIGDGRSSAPYQGRSFGCPAVPQEHASKVINLIKDGTTLFIYKPVEEYVNGSQVLNG